ncbi:MAG: NTP transferase domain-containing protein [Oscillospiraceae bacterium]|nr:NTP transferase domain-containing protein [Oscillospiraceae bacterium]
MLTSMIILAAGLSERMGVFKPMLPVGSQSAAVRCIRTAQAAGVHDIIVVTGNNRDELVEHLRNEAPEARTVHNNDYNDGMFSSTCVGAAALSDNIDGFFVLPSDCCAISADTLKTLEKHFTISGAQAVTRPKFDGRRGHPPLIPIQHREGLLAYSGDGGLKGFLSPLPTVEVELDNRESLLDMDTPADYAELLVHLGLPTYPDAEQCAALFAKHRTPYDIIKHGEDVAALASELAQSISQQGKSIDLDLLKSACRVHDICRMHRQHAKAGMELLLKEGFPAAAVLIGTHMDLPDYVGEVGEAELLFLADKLWRRGKLTPLGDTLRELEATYANDPQALAGARQRLHTAQAILGTLDKSQNLEF